MVDWAELPGTGYVRGGNRNFIPSPTTSCASSDLKLTGPLLEEGLAQKKQDLVELYPVHSDPPLKIVISKGL